ncbi:hypothetical protein HDU77_003811 [Chytriomyces hyalinus]|nr:hypothetical protein HDU77_003811 [Chytriomyces hyalinus]
MSGPLAWLFWLVKNIAIMFAVMVFANVILPQLMKALNPPQIGTLVKPIRGLKFLKGRSFTIPDVENKRVTVLENWATWCGPCVRGIPHLTELAKRYPDVSFVGVSQEQDVSVVQAFIDKMGDEMDYSVAVDPRGLTKEVVAASGGMGIPHAILMDAKGVMVWAGHPMDAKFEEAIQSALKAQ